MDAAALISAIDDHGFTDTSSARKVAVLNDVIWDICSLEPWRFLEKNLALTFDGSSAVPTNWPSDFKSVVSIVDTSRPRRLYPIRIEEFRTLFGATSTTSGDPLYYYFLGDDTMYVYPIPASSNTTTTMVYLHTPAAITSASTESAIAVPPRHHNAILYGSLAQLYALDDDPENSQLFKNFYDERVIKMRDDLWMNQWDRPDTIEISDPDDYYS